MMAQWLSGPRPASASGAGGEGRGGQPGLDGGDGVLDEAALVAAALELGAEVEGFGGDEVADAGVVDDVGDFPGGELEVERHDDGAEADDGHVAVDEFDGVAGDEADVVARPDAAGVEEGPPGGDLGAELFIGRVFFAVEGDGVVGSPGDQLVNKHPEPLSFSTNVCGYFILKMPICHAPYPGSFFSGAAGGWTERKSLFLVELDGK